MYVAGASARFSLLDKTHVDVTDERNIGEMIRSFLQMLLDFQLLKRAFGSIHENQLFQCSSEAGFIKAMYLPDHEMLVFPDNDTRIPLLFTFGNPYYSPKKFEEMSLLDVSL